MAVFALMDAKVSLQVGSSSAVSISSYVTGGTLEHSNDPLETTAMGSTTKTRTYGVQDWTAKIELNQDFTVIDALLWSAHNASAVTLTIIPVDTSVSATNPQYAGNVLLPSYSPISQNHGELAKVSLDFVANGALARTTS
ncbi:hypothetical protein KKE60_06775 [Patescibacteria group bacterium]|nr:hypothetical protein [Patescibacteria group bacterium]